MASARRHRYPQCRRSGKIRYRWHADAVQALQLARRQAQLALLRGAATVHRHEKRIYRCGACGGWHLTSRSQVDFGLRADPAV
jgi:hypothetical protein